MPITIFDVSPVWKFIVQSGYSITNTLTIKFSVEGEMRDEPLYGDVIKINEVIYKKKNLN